MYFFFYRFEEQFILPRSYSGRATQGYWGWISGNFCGELVPVNRRQTAVDYLEILDNVLVPTVTAIYGNQQRINIIEDNSSVHTADIVKNWYRDHPLFNRLDMPPRSPDINVIENFWAEMVREWRPTMARNHDELMERVNEAWEELRHRPHYFRSLTDSMPKRLQKIIDVGGAHINY